MKIEVGKSYRTRDGVKVEITGQSGPDVFVGETPSHPRWVFTYTSGGRYSLGGPDHRNDIVAEWAEPQGWEWFGHALHFCDSDHCCFRLGTKVGPWVVSTVGDYFLADQRQPLNAPIEGEAPLYYETKVFAALPPVLGCGCPDHNGREIDGRRYKTAQEATAGHLELCRKWESVPKGGAR